MADTEFEEFRLNLEDLPHCINSSAQNYKLVHDVAVEQESSRNVNHVFQQESYNKTIQNGSTSGVLHTSRIQEPFNFSPKKTNYRSDIGEDDKNKKYGNLPTIHGEYEVSLADELQTALDMMNKEAKVEKVDRAMVLTYLKEDNSSDSELCDSGNSTAHSPDGIKSMSPQLPLNFPSTVGNFAQLDLLEATHRVLYKFIARHSDELELDIGDPIYVQKEAEDLWCEGINLRNGRHGIFPSAYVVDVDYNDFDPMAPQMKRERFLLSYLGSVETLYHKGNSVLCQAIHKINSTKHKPHSCILEVSDQGLRMFDRLKPNKSDVKKLDYFYSLKNVSFCAFHPQDPRFMGFITKHPQFDRFACHVFHTDDTTRPVAESIGRAFQRFYQKFIETAYPVEDIYIE